MSPAFPDAHLPLDRLRQWAALTPDRVALADDTTTFTYADLLRVVESTAAAARAALADAQPGAYLPVLVDRTATAAAAVLACLLGRVRFVPIDASASPDLVRSLVRRSGDCPHHLLGAPDPGSLAGTAIAAGSEPPADASTVLLPPDDDPALLIFSSGTTGEPKGIVMTWRALEQRWRSRHGENDVYTPLPEVLMPLLVPLDSSWGIAEVILVAGGVSEFVVDPARMHPRDFLAKMAQVAPTTLTMPAQLARILAQLPARSATALPSVRLVKISAEALHYEHLTGLRSILRPDTVVMHALSSTEGGRETEGTVVLVDAPVAGQAPVGGAVFPDEFRLADHPDLDPDVGEAEIGGALALEYLDDPDLTAARFRIDPEGRRWWRSGDLLRALPDGGYLHAGRVDDLVKVRGRLTAPGDVTAVLLDLPAIAAAVTLPEVLAGNTRLVAHVEVRPGSGLALAEVRAHLSARLPAHAVPAAVFRHARLPVTARGKVDRDALRSARPEAW